MSEYSAEEVRARFEAWVSGQSWFKATLGLCRRDSVDSEYPDPCINSRWQGWGAAYADLLERIKADEGVGPVGNLDVIREVIGELRSEAPKRPSAHYLADKLEAAIAAQPATGTCGEKCRRIAENRDYWHGVAEERRQELFDRPPAQPAQLWEMKQRACRAHALCNELRLAHPEITELGDDGVLHEAIHDILRVDTPTAAPAQAAQAERTAKDYAIEHAGYLADAAEQLMTATQDANIAADQLDEDDGDDETNTNILVRDNDHAQTVLSEAQSGLRAAIYEFKKRRDRAAEPAAQGEAVQQEEYGGPDFEERCETLAKIERDMRIYLDEDMLLTPYTLERLCNRIKNVRDAGHDNVVMSLYNFRTLRRLAAQPRAVPDGWKAVTSALVSAAELMISEIDTCGHEVDPAYRLHLYEAKDAAKALLAAAPSPGESNNKPTDCSGDPSSCPDNEGRGCYCSDLLREGESA